MTEISEQRELSLVGKVELRIALVETDSKLESTLNTYLPPLLVGSTPVGPTPGNRVLTFKQLKLASEHLSVRNKVSGNATSAVIIALLLSPGFRERRAVAQHI